MIARFEAWKTDDGRWCVVYVRGRLSDGDVFDIRRTVISSKHTYKEACGIVEKRNAEHG